MERYAFLLVGGGLLLIQIKVTFPEDIHSPVSSDGKYNIKDECFMS